MNILITYYSRTGNTEQVAKKIDKILNADLEKLIDKKKRTGIIGWIRAGYDAIRENLTELEPIEKDPSKYDLVLLGTPVWAGHATPAIKTYVENNRDDFKRIAIFSSSGGDGFQDVLEEVRKASGKKSLAMQGFIEKEIKENKIGSKVEEFTNKIQEKLQSES